MIPILPSLAKGTVGQEKELMSDLQTGSATNRCATPSDSRRNRIGQEEGEGR